jgi:recombination protein RecA
MTTSKRKKDLLDKIAKKVNKHKPKTDANGTFEISRLSEDIPSDIKYVLTTGIDVFDTATGGLPFGRIVEIYGLDACGKTGMSIRSCIRANQRHIYEKIKDDDGTETLRKIDDDSDVTVLYIDNEESLSGDHKIVVDGTTLDCIVANADTIDRVFSVIEMVLDEIDNEKKETGREQWVVVVVDTIASTSSREELNREWGEVDYARQPQQLRQAFRKTSRNISRKNVCMICTNQVSDRFDKGFTRNKPSTPQDSDFSTFGGKALKYYASLRIFMYRMNWAYKMVRKARFDSGYLIGFKTTKNRMVKPLREGRMSLIFDKGFDNVMSMLETFLFLKMAEDTGEKIVFRLGKFAAVKSPEADDDDVDDGAKLSIGCRAEWPEFYQAHKQEFDAFWETAKKMMFEIETSETAAVAEEILDEEEV